MPNQLTARIEYAAPAAVTICALLVCSHGEGAGVVGDGAVGGATTGREVRTGAEKCLTGAGSAPATGRTKCSSLGTACATALPAECELPTAKDSGATTIVVATAQTVASAAVAHRRPFRDRRGFRTAGISLRDAFCVAMDSPESRTRQPTGQLSR